MPRSTWSAEVCVRVCVCVSAGERALRQVKNTCEMLRLRSGGGRWFKLWLKFVHLFSSSFNYLILPS